MRAIKQIRPSNLVILAALPFIIYLFATSSDYQRSLVAIVGIEHGSGGLFRDFLVLCLPAVLGLVLPVLCWRGDPGGMKRGVARLCAWLGIAAALGLAFVADVSALAVSIVVDAVDPANSPLLQKGVLPRQLTTDAAMAVTDWAQHGALAYGLIAAGLGLAAIFLRRHPHEWGPRRHCFTALVLLHGLVLGYLIFVAHLGFATGLFTSLRAASFAYVIACVLGLLWASLLRLEAGRRTILRYGIAVAVLAAAAGYFFLQPHSEYVLAGSLDKRVAIVGGTPKALVEAVRFGDFTGAPAEEVAVRTVPNSEAALAAISANADVSAALLPVEAAPADLPVLWRTSLLPDRWRTPGLILAVLAILLGLLTFGAYHHQQHPLAVGAEFFIDTVRGIPMLVIVLYIGLPVSGAVKDATGGAIDMANVTRGVIAMAIGYSAYLAEIFRAGINSVPLGQLEAGRSLGLSRWQIARLIILPQALRVIIPPLGNEFIAIMKDTSLLSILSVRDVTQRMREFQSASFLPFAPFNATAILYVCLALAAASAIKSIERKYHVKSR